MSKFVRNPIRAIREPFGTAGLIVAMIALVAALGGTALAAAKLNSTQKKEVEKIAKKVAGKPGVAGPAGSAGPAGPAGSAGAKGDKGDAGSPGSPGVPGTPGAPGTSVSSEEFGIAGKEGKCVGTGGSKFTAGTTKTFACNGKNGAIQPEETLPSGASETGAWAAQTATQFEVDAPISFTIPLAAPLDGAECGPETGPPPATCQVHFINKEGKEVPSFGNELASHPSCPGSAEAPEALPG
ncbi:MAG: hypothetical protein JWM24_188, partial [Solirubrobacterales bacterium]|nr:hypothetical protein [Solirubrobacterales bacterium]